VSIEVSLQWVARSCHVHVLSSGVDLGHKCNTDRIGECLTE
jgi:hypothetical protein